MKYLFYKIQEQRKFLGLPVLFLIAISFPSLATITFVSPTSSSSFTQCGSITLITNTSQFVGNGVAEVYKNGVLVRTAYVYLNQTNVVNNISSSGLAAGTDYQVKIYDQYNTSNYGWSSYFSIVENVPPSNLFLVLSNYNFFEVGWSTVNGASNYRVDVSTTSDFSTILPSYNNYLASGSDSNGLYVTGLTAGATYYTRIRTVNPCGTSPNSVTFTVTLPCPTPSSPTATSVTSITASSFVANWNSSTNAFNGYDLVVTRSGYAPVTYSTTGTSYTVSGIQSCSNYSYYVVAKGCSNSSNSNSISVTSILPAPVITSGSGDGSYFGYSWTAVPGAAYYQYQASTNSDYSNPITSLTTTETNVSFPYAWCVRTYFRVRAYCSLGTYSVWETESIPPGAGCRIAGAQNLETQEELDDAKIEFYPNPTDQFLKIELSKPVDKDRMIFKVSDSKGREMNLPMAFFENYVELDVSEIPKGLYIVSVRDISFSKSFKFIRK